MATKLKPLTKAELRTLASLQKRHHSEEKVPVPLHVTVTELRSCDTTPAPPNGIQATLDERGARYGDFTDHARIAQDLQDVMRNSVTAGVGVNPTNRCNAVLSHGWNQLSAVQKQALTVIADKIARILSGDPNYGDNWHDIQGYAKLPEERL